MKNSICRFTLKGILFLILFQAAGLTLKSQPTGNIPFSTNTENLTIWNGSEYVPFFIKGVNLGVAIPGTFPGEMAASGSDYTRWFGQIKEAGFNCIRLYTLHFPRFYEALHAFNTANPHNPLLIIHGVWLEEEMPGYTNNLYFLSNAFRQEIEENIDCVHGNRTIAPRTGKAFGSYTADVSEWCLAFIIGREVYPDEVLTTPAKCLGQPVCGNHFSISGASPSEAWFTSMLDHTVSYKQTHYKTQRPVSVSSWPTSTRFPTPKKKIG
jgi:hypothetical protein